MSEYTLAVGMHEPHGFSTTGEAEAIVYAVDCVEAWHADELIDRPKDVVMLIGAGGLVTRPSERISEFVKRVPGEHLGVDPNSFQPGDANTPDCNGD